MLLLVAALSCDCCFVFFPANNGHVFAEFSCCKDYPLSPVINQSLTSVSAVPLQHNDDYDSMSQVVV